MFQFLRRFALEKIKKITNFGNVLLAHEVYAQLSSDIRPNHNIYTVYFICGPIKWSGGNSGRKLLSRVSMTTRW